MPEIKQIFSLVSSLTDKDRELIQKAYDFALIAHDGHERKNGEPYVSHLFATAETLAQLGMGPVTISAGLLHDAIEDTNARPEDIEREFGKEILFLVEGVTKLGHIKYHGSSRHNESLRKLFVAMSQDIRVLIIKLCDRLHNMRTLEHVDKEKQLRIATETLEIYAPIAYRLGIKKLQRELEDLSFQYVYPEDFKKVQKLSKAKLAEQEAHLDKFQRTLKKELAKNDMRQFHTDYRVKGLYSLYKKLKRKEWNIEKVYDVLALRVVVPTVSDCYRVLGIIHSVWRPLPGRIKDYIAFPKTNGYQSIHTTIFTGDGGIVEVQIKTEQMYQESEYGIASHISYKQKTAEKGKKKTVNPDLSWVYKLIPTNKHWDDSTEGNLAHKATAMTDVPRWVKDLVEYQKEAGEEFMDDIKSDFFDERIFVFTPKGDVIDLPKGSSAIDFAYAIHSDVGGHCSGAKVNGKMVAISTTLHNGDRVEIDTKKSAKPSYKWLEFCKTTMARRHVSREIENKK